MSSILSPANGWWSDSLTDVLSRNQLYYTSNSLHYLRRTSSAICPTLLITSRRLPFHRISLVILSTLISCAHIPALIPQIRLTFRGIKMVSNAWLHSFSCIIYDDQPFTTSELIDTPEKILLSDIMTLPLKHNFAFYIGIGLLVLFYHCVKTHWKF